MSHLQFGFISHVALSTPGAEQSKVIVGGAVGEGVGSLVGESVAGRLVGDGVVGAGASE
jgi:hypothetical protein